MKPYIEYLNHVFFFSFSLSLAGTWPWPALTTSIPAIVAALAPWFSPFGSFPLRSVWLPFSDGRMQGTRRGSMWSNSVLSAKMWDTRFLPLLWPFMPLWSSFCCCIGGFLWRLGHVWGNEWRPKPTLIYTRSEIQVSSLTHCTNWPKVSNLIFSSEKYFLKKVWRGRRRWIWPYWSFLGLFR